MLETYSTTNVKRGSKLSYWNDLHHRLLFPCEINAADPAQFDADFSVAGLAGALFVKIASLPAIVERTASHVGGGEQRFTLLMSLKGRIQLSHYGREVVLEQGDFTLCDSLAPSRMSYLTPNEALALTAPAQSLRAYFPLPESVCGLRMSGGRGIGRMLPTMLRCLWAQTAEGLPAELGSALINSVLHVAATAYAGEHGFAIDESAVRSVRKTQVKRFIEARLRDPDLSVGGIATGMGVSSRYINRVFADEGESILAYILRRRLDECARQLTNPLWQGHTATKIAFAWGFGSTAHFSRAFKAHFGATPNEYRRVRPQ